MRLADRVLVARRFQRAIRIDTDLGDASVLKGFVCPESSSEVLKTMARHVSETGQAAFTWTGPYGSGKSSLVVVLSAVLSGNRQLRQDAAIALGEQTTSKIWRALPPRDQGWRILPIVGRRGELAKIFGEAIERARLVRSSRLMPWTDQDVFDALTRIAERTPRKTGGLAVFVDEMGKFLEGAAYDGADIYFFQQLAELASRSHGRLVVVGILHQAFEEYAHRLSREIRDEWAKIQGRFVDLALNVEPTEQLDLLGRSIEVKPGLTVADGVFERVSSLMRNRVAPGLLEACWPLHPIVALLLGPISRRRFGQNQRSIFGFLNSAEPRGFQDFLKSATDSELYTPEFLWDYLQFNLEPSIMASPDGHRWAMAVDALNRCQATGGDELHIRLLKTIGLVDLFKERSGLMPNLDLLRLALNDLPPEVIDTAVGELQEQSLVIYRRFSNAYSIFEGSDFDIEKAIDEAYGSIDELDFGRLADLAGLQPIVAKRHYHATGALRWCETAVVALADVRDTVARFEPTAGSIGTFFLVLPTQGDSAAITENIVQDVAATPTEWDTIIGVPERSAWMITTLARDLMALEQVRDETPELQGDRIARLEVQSRIADIRGIIEGELGRALNDTLWFRSQGEPVRLSYAELSSLASDIADSRFPDTPLLPNELLNRSKPSSNAVAARNVLLRAMALRQGRPRLGIEGYPPEGGLFDSLLLATGLYRNTQDGWRFVEPTGPNGDAKNLAPAWRAVATYLKDNAHIAVSLAEVYDIWRKPPFGIKDGLLPVIAVAFILSRRREVALYREGVFQSRLTDLDVEYLSNDPSDMQIRWMELSDTSRQVLSDMAEIVRDLDTENILRHLEPIDVARGLVSIYDRLPAWVGRTQRISQNAKLVRQLFKQASDPNRFLFDDIPQVLTGLRNNGRISRPLSDVVREGLSELNSAYPNMLYRLRETLLMELGVPNASPSMLTELRERAANIRQLSGDHRLEAFILRVSRFSGSEQDIESLASMAVNKPPRQWVDSDVDRATVELADLSRNFIRHEAYAHVKGRQDHRMAMAVVLGLDGKPVYDEFEVTEGEQSQVDEVVERVRAVLVGSDTEERNIVLAALAKLTSEYLVSRSDIDPCAAEQAVL